MPGSHFTTILRRAAATPAPSLPDRFFLVRDGLGLIIPPTREVTVLKRVFCLAMFAAMGACAPLECGAQQSSPEKAPQEKEQILWQKLEATINDVDHHLDGVLGVAILDLSTGQRYLFHADEVLPTASSIKIAILAELYRQGQQGKLKFGDLYTLQQADLVGGSGIAEALTPGVPRLPLRDVPALMISVRHTSAPNIPIHPTALTN